MKKFFALFAALFLLFPLSAEKPAVKYGVIGPMDIEIEMLKNIMKPLPGKKEIIRTEAASLVFYEGEISGKDVVLVRSGCGKVNSALCAQRLILQFGATAVITTGIAGSIADGLGIMDVVVSTDVMFHDVDFSPLGLKPGELVDPPVFSFESDKTMRDAALSSFAEVPAAKGHRIIAGRISSGDQFIASNKDKERIKTLFDPACVEMEGASVGQTCYLNKIPFIIIRCMSDTASDTGSAEYKFNDKIAAEIAAGIVTGMLEKL